MYMYVRDIHAIDPNFYKVSLILIFEFESDFFYRCKDAFI